MRKYKGYTLRNFEQIEQIEQLDEELIQDIKIVARVLPFKVNKYVLDELIDWKKVPEDPIFQLTFPQRKMLSPPHYKRIKNLIDEDAAEEEVEEAVQEIRYSLNPHPAGQKEYNVPLLKETPLPGVQHKYRETVLFFPMNGQTCFSYCTFCFRWPQFVGIDELKFASKQSEMLVEYLAEHQEIQDVLFTGGDPMVMRPNVFRNYIRPILDADLHHIRTIRIGTKVLSYYPYRLTEMTEEGTDYLELFRDIIDNGKHLSIMGHFNHPKELSTDAVGEAVLNLRRIGAQIRTQSPVLKHINDDPTVWSTMWRKQVDMGMIPYYMFVARDTGPQEYFKVPLIRAWEIFQQAYQKVSGICRTVRGPSMSTTWGKVEILGPTTIAGKNTISLRLIQGRNPDWVGRPFFAEYNDAASWITELKPLDNDKFFFQREEQYLRSYDRIENLKQIEETRIMEFNPQFN